MNTFRPLKDGALAGKRIGILMESDFVENEISYYQMRFAEEGAEVILLSRLWGHDSLTFVGHEQQARVTVDVDLETLDYDELTRYAALIVPSGMVSDRLRFSENVDDLAPAVELMRRAFRIPGLLKAFSCHGLLLMSTAADLMRGRTVTAHNNLVGDVRNTGAVYTTQDVVVDGDVVTGHTVEECHLLARTIINLLSGQE